MRHPSLVLSLASLIAAATTVTNADVSTQKPEVQDAVERSADGKVNQVTVEKPKKLDVKGGPAPLWIWNEGNAAQVAFLRKSFETEAKSGTLIATCDNGMTVKLNGKTVARSGSWESPVTVDVSRMLKKGANDFTVDATNEGNIGGFALKLVLANADKSKQYVISDTSWEMAKDRGFKDLYKVKAIGRMGVGPWGNVFANPRSGDADGLLKNSVARGVFQVLPGFQVELLYDVPKAKQGSWVSIAFDDKGRLYASDQGNKGIYRIIPAPIGGNGETTVEKIDIPISSSQGMLWAFDSLYISVNGGPGSGFYRATDTDGDDNLDKVVKLKAFQGGGEHGPHALRLSPDGQSIYVIAGNHTNPPADFDSSRIPSNWSEDLLLPRQWDARGHARGKLAPGGWIAKTDPEGKTWEMISVGYRNPYDMDFSPEGELFAYDADMEWDMGSSWYRPTRIVHAVSGSEFGWRSGTGKWPTYYADSLPPVVDIGPGSPVGVAFGTGTKFPEKYQKALYCCDWTFGTMYAVHLTPKGASFVGSKEEFVSRTPLPLTDVAVGPDGALYFTVGGRGAQSALYRVSYVGPEDEKEATPEDPKLAELRKLRRSIEVGHQAGSMSEEQKKNSISKGVIQLLLAHDDRHIRYAARIAVEQNLTERELHEVLSTDGLKPQAVITAAVAWARTVKGNTLTKAVVQKLIDLPFKELSAEQQLELLRACALLFIRQGDPDADVRSALTAQLEPIYPSKSATLNRELARLLVYLNSPKVIEKSLPLLKPADEKTTKDVDIPEVLARNSGYGGTVARMLANRLDPDQMHLAFVLRNMKYGWTLEQRREYLGWYGRAAQKSGGASFQGFLKNMQNDWLALASETERKALASDIIQNAPKESELPKPKGPGKAWTVDELMALTGSGLSGRSFENGKRAFAASKCITCHRYVGVGGATGPDLSNVAGRFSYKDLLESTIVPSKVISDQYRASLIQTADGKVITGRLLGEADGKVSVLTDPVDATKIIEIDKDDIDEITPSRVSLMPDKLLNQLNQDEVLDLLAYLMSRGNPADPVFAGSTE